MMKLFSSTSIILSCFLLSSFNQMSKPEGSAIDKIPELNAKIIGYVETQIGKKVKRGECWDLAAVALNNFGAKWDGQYKFGREINPKKETIYPGDIIQFSNVLLQNEHNGVRHRETMTKHTAIVYEVLAKGHFTLAHQNTAFSGRKVGLSPLNLEDIVKGNIKIYRPVP